MQNNIFKILRVKTEERPNDLVLSWLFDPANGHGVANFAASIVKFLWDTEFNEQFARVDCQQALGEKCPPDITVQFERGLLVLENKVNAGALQPTQFDTQHQFAKKRQLGAPLFHVLLHPDRIPVEAFCPKQERDAFRTLRYSELAQLLEAAAGEASSDDAESIIRQYSEYVRCTYGEPPPRRLRMASSSEIVRRNSDRQRWDSREKFITEVERIAAETGSEKLVDSQTEFLELLGLAAGVEVRFEGRGTQATYNIFVPPFVERLLTVRACGSVYANWRELRADESVYSEFANAFAKLVNLTNSTGSDLNKDLTQLDVEIELLVPLQRLADRIRQKPASQ